MKPKFPHPAIMIQGTASGVGKSLVTLGLCRWFARQGLKVAPFKAQNMSLNSSVTIDGGEIGRAQFEQAKAAGVEPRLDMNPILLKPQGDGGTQVIVRGKSIGTLGQNEFEEIKPTLREEIEASLTRLLQEYELVIIEGAGSPVELNLKDNEIVNMFVAKLAGDAPVMLVSDIDRGGVFASIVGTLELLSSFERNLVKGLIINKFRGDPDLFLDGVKLLQDKTDKPVLGVLPYLNNLKIADEDALSLVPEVYQPSLKSEGANILVHIVKLPYISNFDEFDALSYEEGVSVRYIDHPNQVLDCHLLILPGSKATMNDLKWLYDSGIAENIIRRHQNGDPILAVCGGGQMLGHKITDPRHIEGSEGEALGLGLLDFDITFETPKITERSRVTLVDSSNKLFGKNLSDDFEGYEIHCGRYVFHPGARQLFKIVKRGISACENEFDGGFSGFTVGTMIHGLLENHELRRSMLTALTKKYSLNSLFSKKPPFNREVEFDRVADWIESYLNMDALKSI